MTTLATSPAAPSSLSPPPHLQHASTLTNTLTILTCSTVVTFSNTFRKWGYRSASSLTKAYLSWPPHAQSPSTKPRMANTWLSTNVNLR